MMIDGCFLNKFLNYSFVEHNKSDVVVGHESEKTTVLARG